MRHIYKTNSTANISSHSTSKMQFRAVGGLGQWSFNS